FAQTAPVDDATITLAEFTVSAEQTSGYRATNAITATGIGAKISDVPIAISVVTGQLIQDMAGLEMREALNYVPGVLTNPRGESTVVIRGFSGLISYRNGQYRRQLMTTWNMDRIEVIKGPSAIFFGAVRPGGIVNNVTIKPVFTGNFTDVKATVGSYDHYQGEFFHNQVINDQLAIRVGAGVIDSGGERDFEYKDEFYFGASAIWKPTANQQLTLDLESINREVFYLSAYPYRALANSKVYGVPAAITAQANVNQVTTSSDTANRAYLTSLGFSGTVGAPNFYPLFDMFAPYDYETAIAHDAKQTQESQTVDLDYLLQIRDNLVWQTTLNWSMDDTAGLQPSAGETRPYANGSIRFRTEDFINVRYAWNVHNKLTWRFDLGPSSHTLQFGHEIQNVLFERPGYLDAQNRYNDSPFGAFTYNYTPGMTPPVSVQALRAASGQNFNIVRDRTEINRGAFIVDQARFFNDRVHVLAGARYNSFSGDIKYNRPVSNSSLSAANGGLATTDVIGAKSAWTPQYGVLFKVVPQVSLFATYSESIEPNFQLDADGVPSEPVESESIDFGVKAEFLDGRVTSTLAYYDISRDNLAYRDTTREIATGRSPYFVFGNSEASEGLELDVNWSPTDNFNVIAGWSHVMTAETTASNNTTFVGRRFGGIPENSYFFWGRYTLTDGPLSGLVLGAGVRHNDSTNLSQDPQIDVTLPSFTVYDAMLSYKLPVAGRDLRLQLNVKNLTDKLYREGSDGFFAKRREIFLSASMRF
ncbi:MAG TPA: TonB-dependent receptor, partial [Candidatus Synoicihabitans sp.]|nr:TonB-dependent receptor [Candidatus Synoicihabitans sp.]